MQINHRFALSLALGLFETFVGLAFSLGGLYMVFSGSIWNFFVGGFSFLFFGGCFVAGVSMIREAFYQKEKDLEKQALEKAVSEQIFWIGLEEIQKEYSKLTEIIHQFGGNSYIELIDKSVKTIKELSEKSAKITALLKEESAESLKEKIDSLISGGSPNGESIATAQIEMLKKRLSKAEKMEDFVHQVIAQRELLLETMKTLRFSLASASTDKERESIFKDQWNLHSLNNISEMFD